MTGSYRVPDSVCAVVLAGGRARRMGGVDKGLVTLGDRPMIESVLQVLRPQAAQLLINANRNLEVYGAYGHTVVADATGDFSGPLAGMAAAMAYAARPCLLTAPCDSPLLPPDLARRLLDALCRETAEIAVAHDGERMQPVFALIKVGLLASLGAYLDRGGRKIDGWYEQHRVALADFSDRPETFVNVNTVADRDALAARPACGRGR